MKQLSIIIVILISVSALATPNKADAWVWLVAKKILKTTKPAPKSKNIWRSNDAKYHKGWTNSDINNPDWKQLNYREKDWYK